MSNKNETTKKIEEKPTDSKEQEDNTTSQFEQTGDEPKSEHKEKVEQEDSNSKEKPDNTSESEKTKGEQENKTSNSAQGSDVNFKSEEKKKSKIVIKIIALFIVLGTVGVAVYLNQNKQVIESSTIQVQDYSSLINSWNEQVQNRTDKKECLLSRESNEKTIEQLNEWMKNFYIAEVTDLVEYNKFLESNKQEDLIEFDTSMSEDKIREKLKMLSKDKTMSSIVQKVLMMNDIDFWKKNITS